MYSRKRQCIFLATLFSLGHLFAQPPRPLTKEIRTEVVDSLATVLVSNYIYLDTAIRMGNFIENQLKGGAYDSISDPNEFAERLSDDIHSVYNDHHLAIHFDSRIQKDIEDHSPASDEARRQDFLRMAENQNFGLKKMELLNGNAGYLRLDRFFPVNEESKESVRNALYFFRHARALIIDLRYNGGGESDMVRYICSYFLVAGTEINDIYERRTGRLEKYVTDSVEKPVTFLTIPIYILVGGRTFSGAEELSYDMQQLRRATIVGETTGGGAHPVGPVNISNGFIGDIPFARAINPISGTNWEAVGVKPDVKIGADSALDMALLSFYDYQIVRTKNPKVLKSVAWYRETLYAKMYPVTVDTSVLRSYEGSYSGRKVKRQNGHLYFTGMDGRSIKLLPLSQTTFSREDIDYQKIEFVKDGIVFHFDDGFIMHISKSLP